MCGQVKYCAWNSTTVLDTLSWIVSELPTRKMYSWFLASSADDRHLALQSHFVVLLSYRLKNNNNNFFLNSKYFFSKKVTDYISGVIYNWCNNPQEKRLWSQSSDWTDKCKKLVRGSRVIICIAIWKLSCASYTWRWPLETCNKLQSN